MINNVYFEGNEKDIKILESIILNDWKVNNYEYKMTIHRTLMKKHSILSITIENFKKIEFINFIKMVSKKIVKEGLLNKIKLDTNGEVFTINSKGDIVLDLTNIERAFSKWDRVEDRDLLKYNKSFIVFIEGNTTNDILEHVPVARKIVSELFNEFEIPYNCSHVYEDAAICKPLRNLYGGNGYTKGRILSYAVKCKLSYDFLKCLNDKLMEYNKNLEDSNTALKPLVLLANRDRFEEVVEND